jgi:hypothetical protein
MMELTFHGRQMPPVEVCFDGSISQLRLPAFELNVNQAVMELRPDILQVHVCNLPLSVPCWAFCMWLGLCLYVCFESVCCFSLLP